MVILLRKLWDGGGRGYAKECDEEPMGWKYCKIDREKLYKHSSVYNYNACTPFTVHENISIVSIHIYRLN